MPAGAVTDSREVSTIVPVCVPLPVGVAGLNVTERPMLIVCPIVIVFGNTIGGEKYVSCVVPLLVDLPPSSLHDVVPSEIIVYEGVPALGVSTIRVADWPLNATGFGSYVRTVVELELAAPEVVL